MNNKEENNTNQILDKLNNSIDKLNELLIKLNTIFRSPFKSISLELLYGMVRGLGFALGMSILVTILAYIASLLIELPVIGKFIANIVNIVKDELQKRQ